MDITKHELLFSKDRLKRYISACDGSPYKGMNLYKYNIQASQALYPIISVLEVSLRNSIDRELTKHFSDPDWLINKRNEFANHPNLTYKDHQGNTVADYFFSEKLKKAEDKLSYRKISLTHGKLMAELTFGFWIKFFDSSPIRILKGVPLQAFKNKPSVKLGTIHSHLNEIVALRNRISHNEPICFNRSGNLCLVTLLKYHSDITAAIKWIDTDLSDWAESINFFMPVYNRIKGMTS